METVLVPSFLLLIIHIGTIKIRAGCAAAYLHFYKHGRNKYGNYDYDARKQRNSCQRSWRTQR